MMDWLNDRAKVQRWVNEWPLGILLHIRDLLATGHCLGLLVMADFQEYRAQSSQTKLCDRSESVL
jgi:hypothetical protein